MGTNGPWNWRLTVPQTVKMMLIRPLTTNLKMTVRDGHAVSACNSPSPTLSTKALTPCLSWGLEGRSRPLDICPPGWTLLLVASIWNKANFPFYQPGLFVGFWTASSWATHTYSSDNILTNDPAVPLRDVYHTKCFPKTCTALFIGAPPIRVQASKLLKNLSIAEWIQLSK